MVSYQSIFNRSKAPIFLIDSDNNCVYRNIAALPYCSSGVRPYAKNPIAHIFNVDVFNIFNLKELYTQITLTRIGKKITNNFEMVMPNKKKILMITCNRIDDSLIMLYFNDISDYKRTASGLTHDYYNLEKLNSSLERNSSSLKKYEENSEEIAAAQARQQILDQVNFYIKDALANIMENLETCISGLNGATDNSREIPDNITELIEKNISLTSVCHSKIRELISDIRQA